MKRYLILAASVIMLACLGTGQAWSAFAEALQKEPYSLSAFETQFIFNTTTFFFCLALIFAGRLQDHWGPRALALASAVMVGAAWWLASIKGANYFYLWLAVGVLGGTGAAVGYVSPIATAVKWFPNRRGLVSGLTAAGFAGGPILLSAITEMLRARGWNVLRIFGLVGSIYAPVIFAMGLLLVVPSGQPGTEEVAAFRRRKLFVDRRFWTLFVGMFCGTLPFLMVMGSAKLVGIDFDIGEAALVVIAAMAVGNASGRIVWGHAIDRFGPRRSMLSAQALMIASMCGLILFGRHQPAVFLAAAGGIGFCYGSCFAIYPAAVARLYGTHVLGSVYPLVMAAQGISSAAPTLNGLLHDRTGSYIPGLSIAAGVAVAGIVASALLSRTIDGKPAKPETRSPKCD